MNMDDLMTMAHDRGMTSQLFRYVIGKYHVILKNRSGSLVLRGAGETRVDAMRAALDDLGPIPF